MKKKKKKKYDQKYVSIYTHVLCTFAPRISGSTEKSLESESGERCNFCMCKIGKNKNRNETGSDVLVERVWSSIAEQDERIRGSLLQSLDLDYPVDSSKMLRFPILEVVPNEGKICLSKLRNYYRCYEPHLSDRSAENLFDTIRRCKPALIIAMSYIFT
jgi:hypothetical protein